MHWDRPISRHNTRNYNCVPAGCRTASIAWTEISVILQSMDIVKKLNSQYLLQIVVLATYVD